MNQLRQHAVGRIEHDRRAVLPVEQAADFDQIFSKEYFAAGKGEPQQAAERAGDLADLLQRQFGVVGLRRLDALQIKAVGTAGIALARDEESELDRPALP